MTNDAVDKNLNEKSYNLASALMPGARQQKLSSNLRRIASAGRPENIARTAILEVASTARGDLEDRALIPLKERPNAAVSNELRPSRAQALQHLVSP